MWTWTGGHNRVRLRLVEYMMKSDVPPHNHISSLSFFMPSICFGLTASLFCSESGWSGIITSHSWSGAAEDDVEDIVRWNLDVGMVMRRGRALLRRRGRRASIYGDGEVGPEGELDGGAC